MNFVQYIIWLNKNVVNTETFYNIIVLSKVQTLKKCSGGFLEDML